MKLQIDHSGLQALVKKMGAERRIWQPNAVRAKIAEIQEKLKGGVYVKLEDIDASAGGLLSHEGQQILVYIRDHTNKHSRKGSVLQNPAFGNRIHIYDCSTLDSMRKDGRYTRYVQTTKTRDFKIDIEELGKVEEKTANLKVCKNCLKSLEYKNYKGGEGVIWKDFDFEEFFSTYSTFFAIPTHYNDFAPPSPSYVKGWSKISWQVRESANWTCQKCNVNLSVKKNRKHLHVHHKDGTKSNNTLKNLVVLCEICHAQEPYHQHMEVTEESRQAIDKARSTAH